MLFSLRYVRPRCYSLLVLALVCGHCLLSFSTTSAQEDEKPKNLKVLDTSLTHEQVDHIMDQFKVALGVGCDHCHVRQSDPNARGLDFAKDSLPSKEAAREMLRMTMAINKDFLTKLAKSDSDKVAVQCITCHRGQLKPEMLEDVLMRAKTSGGMAAVDSTYRALRKKFYGGFSFDFSDQSLGNMAIAVSQESDQDALTLLKLNKEFNPESVFNQWLLGQVYTSLGDTTSAIAEYERALQMSPDSRRVKRDLEALKAKQKP